MFDRLLAGWNPNRLRIWITLFFFALAVPTAMLVNHAWSQLKWEAYYRQRLMAEELAARIDQAFAGIINREAGRAFTDFAFLNVAGDPAANFLQRSPLSAYPVNQDVPGLIGYFQVDAQGVFSTPLLPVIENQSLDYGVSEQELQERRTLQEDIRRILSDNSLVQGDPGTGSTAGPDTGETLPENEMPLLLRESASAPAPDIAYADLDDNADAGLSAQAAFDQLEQKSAGNNPNNAFGIARVEDLELEEAYAGDPLDVSAERSINRFEASSSPLERRLRKEQSVLPERDDDAVSTRASRDRVTASELRISIFESVVDDFDLSLLNSGHLVLFRKVWRDDQRYIQGALLNREHFINDVITQNLRGTAVSGTTDLTVAHDGNVMSVYAAAQDGSTVYGVEDLSGELLFQQRLSAPLDDVELIFSVNNLPPGPGGNIILWLTAIFLLILSSGCYLLYRLGLGQISLARQQQDFVSAVSHELKTPLTSIRMYGEMLREGWAEESKKKSYYSYIHDESERLTRLINNVLQLARMTRRELQLDCRPVTVDVLLDTVRSKVASLVERAGFTLEIQCDTETGRRAIDVDIDCITQILINLVDNSLKFAAKSERKQICISCQVLPGTDLQIAVRDYGPGIAGAHMKKIFRLFYRPENELTRDTVGTGIGLALVKQMVHAMHGSIDVVNMDPGAEFRLVFPAATLGRLGAGLT